MPRRLSPADDTPEFLGAGWLPFAAADVAALIAATRVPARPHDPEAVAARLDAAALAWRARRAAEGAVREETLATALARIRRQAEALAGALPLVSDADPFGGPPAPRLAPALAERLRPHVALDAPGRAGLVQGGGAAEDWLTHVAEVVRALAIAARAAELAEPSPEAFPDVGSPGPSTGALLVADLLPLYRDLFGRRPGVSRPAPMPGPPGGPTLRFLAACFARIVPESPPTAETLATWVRAALREGPHMGSPAT